MKKTLSILLLFIGCSSYAQTTGSFEFACIQYADYFDSVKVGTHHEKNNLIIFREGFDNDSIEVYIDQSRIFTGIVTTQKYSGYAGSVQFRDNGKFTVLKIINRSSNSFTEIPYDNRHRIVRVIRATGEKVEPHWIFTFTNHASNNQ